MTVKRAKKLLKSTMSDTHPDRKFYKSVVWKKKKKVFRTESFCGRVSITIFETFLFFLRIMTEMNKADQIIGWVNKRLELQGKELNVTQIELLHFAINARVQNVFLCHLWNGRRSASVCVEANTEEEAKEKVKEQLGKEFEVESTTKYELIS